VELLIEVEEGWSEMLATKSPSARYESPGMQSDHRDTSGLEVSDFDVKKYLEIAIAPVGGKGFLQFRQPLGVEDEIGGCQCSVLTETGYAD